MTAVPFGSQPSKIKKNIRHPKIMIKKFMLTALRVKYQLLFIVNIEYTLKALFKLFTTPKFQKVRKREEALLEQVNFKLTVDGITSTYYKESSNNGPYVLLLHGWEGNAGNMEAFVQPLVEKGYKVVIPNAPAHYTSSGEQCTLREYQKIVTAYIEKFNVKIVISHSFGSAAGLLAVQQLKREQIHKMVLISSPDKMIIIVSKFTDLLNLSSVQKSAFINYVEDQLNLPFDNAVLSKILSQLEIETLIVHDKYDRIAPVDNAHKLVESYEGNRLLFTENQGHYRILWDYDMIETVISFLSDEVKNENTSLEEVHA
ncbi:alpha/beta fold hydrolase [Robiginitalea sp. IMCC44478]|uniref:alpha/beta fold hydrolase n=1 Tax=Robiginitalea sp. IMCC44478 TaxID=3459122 RepID=UPI004041E28E